MCSRDEFPPYDDTFPHGTPDPFTAPEPQRPRAYRLSGSEPPQEPASVALAVLGEMLTEAEAEEERQPYSFVVQGRVAALREARNRVMAAGG